MWGKRSQNYLTGISDELGKPSKPGKAGHAGKPGKPGKGEKTANAQAGPTWIFLGLP